MVTMAEQGICFLFLYVRHAGIEVSKNRGQFLDPICVGIGDLAVGFEIVNSSHVLGMIDSSLSKGIHDYCIVEHCLGDLAPLFFLRRRDL